MDLYGLIRTSYFTPKYFNWVRVFLLSWYFYSVRVNTDIQHRQSIAKLRSGNHNLRIETGGHCVPKTPENLRVCQHCLSNGEEHETHFLLECSLHKCARKTFYDDTTSKYPNFINFTTIRLHKSLFLVIFCYFCWSLLFLLP